MREHHNAIGLAAGLIGVLLISVTYVLVNLLTDLAYAWVDPRVRLGGGH